MINIIENKFLRVAVKTHGAELCSLKSLKSNKEYIWQADEKYWNKHAPILFPIIGFLKDNEYEYNNEIYNLNKHGFARDLDFKLINKKKEKLVYLLEYNEYTLKKYPFKFQLYVNYILENKKLKIVYEVVNKDNKEMYFSIGGHPAFNCDIESKRQYIKFEKEENLNTYILNLETGLLEHDKNRILQNKNVLPLDYELFHQDTLVFERINSDSLYIMDSHAKENLKITIKKFPYLTLWSPKAPFLCIEPWYGVPDFIDSKNKIENKIGIEKLEVEKIFRCNYDLEII
ncbi:aldose 1-epimerase family protein [Clostridium massiliodielmoense]|uniref:aldose 1-epimerase family protein n=1 Tax=Clostridium massiliodielmoense TaxID=1776385 RepID=UPI0004D5BFE4|nr:aldose 1-epimerase family protein [Clostridium massiliodielmoense]KEH97152.1 aldose epimerase [Clostridium botulinum C/D str. BKT12695]